MSNKGGMYISPEEINTYWFGLLVRNLTDGKDPLVTLKTEALRRLLFEATPQQIERAAEYVRSIPPQER